MEEGILAVDASIEIVSQVNQGTQIAIKWIVPTESFD
jgi:hypothetical protein